jgi:hypothetical protein
VAQRRRRRPAKQGTLGASQRAARLAAAEMGGWIPGCGSRECGRRRIKCSAEEALAKLLLLLLLRSRKLTAVQRVEESAGDCVDKDPGAGR